MGNEASREREAAAEAAKLAEAQQEDVFDLDAIPDGIDSTPPYEIPLPTPYEPPPNKPPPIPPQQPKMKKPHKRKKLPFSGTGKRKSKKKTSVRTAPYQFPEQIQVTPWQPTAEEQRRVRLESPEMHDEYARSESSQDEGVSDHPQIRHDATSWGNVSEDETPLTQDYVQLQLPVSMPKDQEQQDENVHEQQELEEQDPQQSSDVDTVLSIDRASNLSDAESVVNILNGEDEDSGYIIEKLDLDPVEVFDDEVESNNAAKARPTDAAVSLVDEEMDSPTSLEGLEYGDDENVDESIIPPTESSDEESSEEADVLMVDAPTATQLEPAIESAHESEESANDSDDSDGDENEEELQRSGSAAPSLIIGEVGDQEDGSQFIIHLPESTSNKAGRFICVEIPARQTPTGVVSKSRDASDDSSGSERMNREPVISNLRKCQHCSASFNTQHKLDRHLLTHGPPQFCCPFCEEKKFNRRDKTMEHIKRWHDPAQFAEARLMSLRIDDVSEQPRDTTEVDITRTTLRKSLRKRHRTTGLDAEPKNLEKSRFPCPRADLCCCIKTFESSEAAEQHGAEHEAAGRFVCPVCKHGCSGKRRLKKHQLRFHTGASIVQAKMLYRQGEPGPGLQMIEGQHYKCPYERIFACEGTFSHADDVERHCSLIHELDCCVVCDKPFTDEAHNFQHKMKYHPVWELQEARKSIEEFFNLPTEPEPQDSPSIPRRDRTEASQANAQQRSTRATRSRTKASPQISPAEEQDPNEIHEVDESDEPDEPDTQSFLCPYAEDYGCTKTFKWKKTALRHGETHEWEYPCICGKVFSRKDLLMDHFNSLHPPSEKSKLKPRAKASAVQRGAPRARPANAETRPPRKTQQPRQRSKPMENVSAIENQPRRPQSSLRKRKRAEDGSSLDQVAIESSNPMKRLRRESAGPTFTLNVPPNKLVDRRSRSVTLPVMSLGDDEVDSGFGSADRDPSEIPLDYHQPPQAAGVADHSDREIFDVDDELDESSDEEVAQKPRPRSSKSRPNRSKPAEDMYDLDSALGGSNEDIDSELEDPELFCRVCHKHFKSERARKAHDDDKRAHDNLEECDVCERSYHSYSALRQHKIDTRHHSPRGGKVKASGRFTEAEIRKIKKWRKEFSREYNLDKARFNDLMTDTKNMRNADWSHNFITRRAVLALFYDVLPNRKPDSMRLYRDLNFFNGDRDAEWISEDDRDIIRLHKELGPRWAEIGARISRPWFDVRRRFEGKLKYGGKLEQGEWSAKEASNFSEAVEEVRTIIDRPPGDNFNWQAVSQRIGTRTPAQCANHWRAMHGLSIGNRWHKPRGQKTAQRPISPMERRLLGQPISHGKTPVKSAEFIDDSDEKAGIASTSVNGHDNRVQNRMENAKSSDDDLNLPLEEESHRPESDTASQSADDEQSDNDEKGSDEEQTLPRNPLSNQTPARILSLSQAFQETQAHTSAVRHGDKPFQNSTSQARPSPNVSLRHRPERSTPRLFDRSSLQPLTQDVEMTDAPQAVEGSHPENPEDDVESNFGGSDDDRATASVKPESASANIQVNRTPYVPPQYRPAADSSSDEDELALPITQTPQRRDAVARTMSPFLYGRTASAVTTPEIDETSSSDSNSESESEPVPSRDPVRRPKWARTPANKRGTLDGMNDDFIASVEAAAMETQRRIEVMKRAYKRDDSEDESD